MMQTEIRRAAIYTRKSTAHRLDQAFSSLDAQRDACEGYIRNREREGWRAVETRYDDGGFSGASIDRPAFKRLLADVEARRVDVVVVYKVDRLSRSLLDFARVMHRLAEADVGLVSVTQNFSTADPMGRLTLNMLMSFAEFEREMIAERTRDKIAAARRKGRWTGGPVPMGYDSVEQELIVNEVEAAVVRELFTLYEQHRSALEVANALNDRGRVTKRHGSQRGRLRKSRPWTKAAVLRVLQNAVYAGLMPYKDEVFPGHHEAIIDEPTWRRVQAILRVQRRDRKKRYRNPDYLLSGKLCCGACGKAFTPASTGRNGKTYRYYRCVTRDKEGRKACPSKPLPAEAIEGFVVQQIRAATADGALADEVLASVRARVETQRAALEREAAALPKAIAGLSVEGQRLVGRVAEVAAPAGALLSERLDEVGESLARHQDRLAEVERELMVLDELSVESRWVADMLRDFGAVWDAMTASNRRKLVQALLEEVEVNEPAGTVTARFIVPTPGTGGSE